ncbi:hypothetical protein PVAND_005069 [Polypedilum vanderplanki]|uniref:Tudor domain-containing protein n=1 Tax=Polypedilum vanderplanki TaxID=319348 RepID=A0A9J6BZX9_POLVA|nr:hypothetical protein PVAND_005069 [Polypedilum vanderplanki]
MPFAMPVPNLCSICDRPAFLTCIDCDTIYCSAVCQVADWSEHQKLPAHINKTRSSINNIISSVQPRSNVQRTKASSFEKEPRFKLPSNNKSTVLSALTKSKPNVSVNDRLKLAAMKETVSQKNQSTMTSESTVSVSSAKTNLSDKLNSLMINEEQIQEKSEVEGLINTSSSDSDSILNVPDSSNNSTFSDKYKTNRKLQLQDDGFCRVFVKHRHYIDDEQLVYYILPIAFEEEYKKYLQTLDNTYNDRNFRPLELSSFIKNAPELIIAKLENNFARCAVLTKVDVNNCIQVIDIDSGSKKILNITKDIMKAAINREYEIMPYCIKAILNNVDASDIDFDDVIEIKELKSTEDGYIIAEVKYSDSDDEEETLPLPTSTVQDKQDNKTEEKRYTVKDIKLKVLKPGKIKLSFLDGSKLKEGKMCICESLNENTKFFEELDNDISNYVKANPNAGNYVPILHELVLSKYTDGNYYRALCKNIDENGCSVVFLEYFNDFYVQFKDIMKLPESLLRKSVSRVISIKLASGKSFSDVDIDASLNQFEINQEFEAIVHDDVKSATVDDSFFIFKK